LRKWIGCSREGGKGGMPTALSLFKKVLAVAVCKAREARKGVVSL